MKSNFGLRQEILDTASELEKVVGADISIFELLQIATKIQQNRILEDALMVGSNKHPGALEAIAMAMGTKSHIKAEL